MLAVAYVLTYYSLWRYVLGDALQVTMQLLLTMPTRVLPYPCFYAYTSPILTVPMLTRCLALSRLFLHLHSYATTYEVPHDWKTIKLMPSTSSVEWLRRVTANQSAHNAMAEPETQPPEHAADAPPAPSPSEDDCPPLA